MPPWVARQWHVLSVSRSATSVLRCSRYMRPAACNVLARTIAHLASDNAPKQSFLSTRNSAIIIPSVVAGIQPDHLIQHIEPLDLQYFSKDRFAVFFLTPAFATWALDDQVFLQKALGRIFGRMIEHHSTPHVGVNALIAVVDKLPTPRPIEDVDSIEKEALHRMRTPPVSDSGHEGMAYTTLRFSDVELPTRTTSDGKGSIRFLTSEGSNENGFYDNSLRLQLANTVFQTGLPSTMILSTWEKRQDSQNLVLKSKVDLTDIGLKLRQNRNNEQRSALAIPLIPLTVPRLIEAGMGNILRRVVGSDGKSVAASEELEKVVPAYFKCRNESPQAISAWALLIPKDALESVLHVESQYYADMQQKEGMSEPDPQSPPWLSLWKGDPPKWNDLVTFALSKGARLHRVLSGGGGWGKKAGLLSLEPLGGTDISEIRDYSGDDEEPGDLTSALQQVTRPGDSIQFFISPSVNDPVVNDPDANVQRLKELSKECEGWTWELGTIPSTTDSLQTSSWQYNTTTSQGISVIRHSFGALSEGAMTIRRQFKLKASDPLAVVGTTKVDVPFSRFCSVNIASGNEEEMDEAEEKPFQARISRSDVVLSEKMSGDAAPPPPAPVRVESLRDEQEDISPELPDEVHTVPTWTVAPREDVKMYTQPKMPSRFRTEMQMPSSRDKASGFDTSSEQLKLENMRKQAVSILKSLGATEPPKESHIPTPIQTAHIPGVRKYKHKVSEVLYVQKRFNRTAREVRKAEEEVKELLRFVKKTSSKVIGVNSVDDIVSGQAEESMTCIDGLQKDAHDMSFSVRQRFINKLPGAIRKSQRKVHWLERELRSHLVEMRRSTVDKVIEYEVNSIDTALRSLHNEVENVTNFIKLRAELVADINNSAVDVYMLNIFLRWQIAAMIERHTGRAKEATVLGRKLKRLRSFNQNLFVFFKPPRERYIQNRLDGLERQQRGNTKTHPFRGAQNLKRQPKSIREQRQQHGHTIWDNRKIRKVFDRVPIRYQRRSSKLRHPTPRIRHVISKPIIRFLDNEGLRRLQPKSLLGERNRRRTLKTAKPESKTRPLDKSGGKAKVRKFSTGQPERKAARIRAERMSILENKRAAKRELNEQVSSWLGS